LPIGISRASCSLIGHLSLVGQCRIYGIEHPFALAKDLLQRSFLDQCPGQCFSDTQIQYAAADAGATLWLYLAQQRDVIAAGLYSHLIQVEFPYAEANAVWSGMGHQSAVTAFANSVWD
jgi:hypothetical protein